MQLHCVSRWNVYILQKMIHRPSNIKFKWISLFEYWAQPDCLTSWKSNIIHVASSAKKIRGEKYFLTSPQPSPKKETDISLHRLQNTHTDLLILKFLFSYDGFTCFQTRTLAVYTLHIAYWWPTQHATNSYLLYLPSGTHFQSYFLPFSHFSSQEDYA